MMKKFSLLGVGIVIGLALALAGWQALGQRLYTYHGSLIDPPVQASDFTLLDQNGNAFRLSDQRGNVVLIFFGYTNCPDVCPVTLSEFKKIKTDLGKDAARVRFVFITVDPERDSAEQIRSYLRIFDPTFIGLSGSQSELELVWQKYGVYREKQPSASALGYEVEHTARVYVIDPQGNWRLTYPFGMETQKITQDLFHLIREE